MKNLKLLAFLIAIASLLLFLFGGGKTRKKVELGSGISVCVPGNFPKQVVLEKAGVTNVSFSIKPHKNAPRFINFFEIFLSDSEIDVGRLLPEKGYKIGNFGREAITIHSEKANLDSNDLEITLPCGGKVKNTLYALRHFFLAKKKYLTIITFSMTKKGLVDIIRTINCH